MRIYSHQNRLVAVTLPQTPTVVILSPETRSILAGLPLRDVCFWHLWRQIYLVEAGALSGFSL